MIDRAKLLEWLSKIQKGKILCMKFIQDVHEEIKFFKQTSLRGWKNVNDFFKCWRLLIKKHNDFDRKLEFCLLKRQMRFSCVERFFKNPIQCKGNPFP